MQHYTVDAPLSLERASLRQRSLEAHEIEDANVQMQEQVKGKRGSAGERLLGLICKNTPIREEEEQEASLTPEDPRRRGRVILLEETEDQAEEYEEEDMRQIAANIKEKD